METTLRVTGLWSSLLVLICTFCYGKSQCPSGPLVLAPTFPNVEQDVVFNLYTNNNPVDPQILKINDPASITESNFNPSWQTRFTIHGWKGNLTSRVTSLIKNAYFRVGNYNIIAVDWSTLSCRPYPLAVYYVTLVGAFVANFVDFLFNNNYLTDALLPQCIGHSLGAHVCGFTGKNLKTGRLGVIHGLDAASPLYEYVDPTERLTDTDADYVQAMHTSASTYGLAKPIGHVDFYVAYGKAQPACGIDFTCSHLIANDYLADAIVNPNMFLGQQCRDVASIILLNTCDATGITVYMNVFPIPPELYGVYYVPLS